MAAPIGTAGEGHPDLNLTVEEKRVYGTLLKEADPDGFGAVSGDVAVKFFEKTKLPPDILGQIWQIADTENRGFLTPSGFGVVLRLIGHAQAGRVPAASLAPQPAPIPTFEGGPKPSVPAPAPVPAPIAAQYSGTPSSPTSTGPGPIRVPALSPEKVNEYSGLFEKSGAENGALSGPVAKQIFERARLPNEVLGRIWNLADTQSRGSLDVVEFVIAMHLLASYKSGAMRGVPNSLPPGLYDAAARRQPPRMAASPRPGSASGYPTAIAPQVSGYGLRPQSPSTRPQAGAPLSVQSTGDAWLITPADKARFDQIYASIDRPGLGYINGDQAVGFFSNARLPEETLAQIWDLADINSEGRLNRDEFAVAMYLIRQQRGTKDGRGNLPSTLPAALVPPSMRKQIIPPSQPTAPSFENAPITQPRSAAEDLFGLDVLSPSQPTNPVPPAPASVQITQSTGGTDVGPFGTPTSPSAPAVVPPAAAAAAASIFKPFQPSSSFGQSMIPQSTGSPGPDQSRAISGTVAGEDLLGDADATVSSKLTNETAELGNLSNQVGGLSKEMSDLQSKRSQAEQELSQNAQQKRTFETRLAQLRTAFDKEVQEFKALQEKLSVSRNETKRLQQDIAMIEGNHADTKRQHEKLRTAYETDQQEMTSLKERIRQINAESDQLKPQIEKLKSDARQQKGLVAINKKQLAHNELERDRLRNELEAAQKEVEDATREAQESSRRVEVSKKEVEDVRATPKPTMPAPAQAPLTEEKIDSLPSPPLASPTPSTASNPFMRRDGGAVFSPPMGSPEPKTDHSAFDNIFGPAFGAATATAPAPQTSFRSETPKNQIISDPQGQSSATSTPIPAPDVIEPPTPPSGKQITSESLPFRAPLERSESVTSSVKVVPPASRLSPVDTPRAGTPGSSTPGTDRQTDNLESSAPDAEQESVRQTLPQADISEKASGVPGAFPTGTPQTEVPPQNINPTTVAVGAGAAVIAAGAGLAAAAVNQQDEKQKDVKAESPPTEVNAAQTNFDEYFGGPAHQRTASEQVKDIDDAFANIKSGPTATNGTSRTANQEFPDIQELDDGEDSSVYSEESPLGFDDNFDTKPAVGAASATGVGFASTASGLSEGSRAVEKQPEVASAVPGHLQPRPQLESASSTASSLPGFEQQTSPPAYKDTVTDDSQSQFPREYKGLLPEREDPTSPTLPMAGGSQQPSREVSSPPATYGPEAAQTQQDAFVNTATSSAPKPTGFDFTSAFAGLGTAQVHEEDSDEDDTTFGGQRNQVPEFDPTFDSPAQSRAATVASTTQSPMTTHAAVTNGAPTNQSVFSNNFFGFNDSTTASPAIARSTAQSAQQTNPTASAMSHDWDALFAPLSSPPVAGSTSLGAGVGTLPSEQRTEISDDITARTSAVEISGTSTPIPAPATSTAPQLPSNLKVERPQPGRALSTGTEHDDPILKRLTAMGFSRTDSLAALEKFDYNIDKAADHLMFR